jgi:hypothetical protein
MQGEQLARRTLTIDAAACAALGGLAIVASGPLGFLTSTPRRVVAALGGMSLVRATLVGVSSRGTDWRPGTATVASVNLIKGLLFWLVALRRAPVRRRITAALLAIGFTGLGATQLQALRGPDA